MKDNFLYSVVYFLAIFQLVPPLFKEGAIFDISGTKTNEYGKLILEHGIYFDNVFYTILYLFITYISGVIPLFLKGEKHRYIRNISFMLSAWCMSGFVYEFANLFYPMEVFNDGSENAIYTQFLIMFIIGMTLITINKKWNKQQL